MFTQRYNLVSMILFLIFSLSAEALTDSVLLPEFQQNYPDSVHLCGSLTEDDVKNSKFSFGVDLQNSRDQYDEILTDHPYVALSMLLFAPVEGWLQSHAAKGFAIGSFSFDAGAVDLESEVTRLLESYENGYGFSLSAYENFWMSLDQNINQNNASFEESEVIRVEYSIVDDTSNTTLPKVRIDIVTEALDIDSRTVFEKEGSRQTYYLSMEPTDSEALPVMSQFDVIATAHLYKFELENHLPE